MQILFLTDNFPPEVNAPARRTYEHCRRWVKLGAKVTVLTCAPNFPGGQVYNGYHNRIYQEEFLEGIRVVRVWSYISPNRGFLPRIADYLSFALSAVVVGLFKKSDLIIATSPQFFTAPAGWLLSLFKRKPWIFEVRDLWPESIIAVGALPRGRLIQALEWLELFLYHRADRIVALTDAFKLNMTNRGVKAAKIFVIKNGVDLTEFAPTPKDQNLAQQLGLTGKFVVCYIGTHGMAHKLDFILRCAAHLDRQDQTHFLLVGDGAEKENLLALKKQLRLTNVSMLEAVPRHEAARYLALADAALVPLKKTSTFKTVIPSKIFESAAMQKPILLGVDGEARALVEQYQAGLYFEPENESAFLNQLRMLKDNKALQESLMQGCRSLAAAFDRDKLAESMFEVLKGVCPSSISSLGR